MNIEHSPPSIRISFFFQIQFGMNSCAPDHNTLRTFFEQRVEFYMNKENALTNEKSSLIAFYYAVTAHSLSSISCLSASAVCVHCRLDASNAHHVTGRACVVKTRKKDKNVCWTGQKIRMRYTTSAVMHKLAPRSHSWTPASVLIIMLCGAEIRFFFHSFAVAYSENFYVPFSSSKF